MPLFSHDGLTFRYVDEGTGVPFIFQHGLGGQLEQPLSLCTPPLHIRLISFDFRGHGDTPLGPLDRIKFSVFSGDIVALMDHLQLEKAVVGGISMGAGVALNFAVSHSNRLLGLVMSRPAWLDSSMPDHNQRLYESVEYHLRVYGAEKGKALFAQTGDYAAILKTAPAAAESFLKSFDHPHSVEHAAKYRLLPFDVPSSDRAEWSNIGVPTLVLANHMDPVHPFEFGEQFARSIPDATFHELTPKSLDEERHKQDTQRWIGEFLHRFA